MDKDERLRRGGKSTAGSRCSQFGIQMPGRRRARIERGTPTIPGRMSKRNGVESEVTIECRGVVPQGTLAVPEPCASIVLWHTRER